MAKRACILLGIRKTSVDLPDAVARKTTPGKHSVVPRCPTESVRRSLPPRPFTPVGRLVRLTSQQECSCWPGLASQFCIMADELQPVTNQNVNFFFWGEEEYRGATVGC